MTFPLHPRLERIWNGEAGKGKQAERLARAAPGLTKQDLGRVGTYGKPPRRFCKPEVIGSIPIRSTRQSAANRRYRSPPTTRYAPELAPLELVLER